VHRSDLIFIILILSVTILLVYPVHPLLIDFILVFNFAAATLILALSFTALKLSELLLFPSLLLLLTAVRIATNVASTRLILTEGYAGEVIKTFGLSLVKGDVLVGLIIFGLIAAVVLIVITRGSLRISEVAARFALESLPAKQLAIEHDLKVGTISQKQGQAQREELAKESLLFGSMEGAMKFIQGDAVISIFTVFVNFIGGIFVGLRSKLTFNQAVEKYSILTVGDGLVSQIPALMLALSAGVIVSRVSSDVKDRFSEQIFFNFFNKPAFLLLGSFIFFLIPLVTQFPATPFFAISGGLIVCFLLSKRSSQKKPPQSFQSVPKSTDQALLKVDHKFLLNFKNSLDYYEQRSKVFYEYISTRYGLDLPFVRVQADSAFVGSAQLEYHKLSIRLDTIDPQMVVLNAPKYYAGILRLNKPEVINIPILNLNGLLVPKILKNLKLIESLKFDFFDACDFLILRAYEMLLRNSNVILDFSRCSAMLSDLENSNSRVHELITSEYFISYPKFYDLLRFLAFKGFSLKNFWDLIEGLSTYCEKYQLKKNVDEYDLKDVLQELEHILIAPLLDFVSSPFSGLSVVTCENMREINSFVEQEQSMATLKSLLVLPADAERNLEEDFRTISCLTLQNLRSKHMIKFIFSLKPS